MLRGLKSFGIFLLTVGFLRGQGYEPSIFPLAGFPSGLNHCYWSSEGSVAAVGGLAVRTPRGWTQHSLPGRDVFASGVIDGGGWWAAGEGFLAVFSGGHFQQITATTTYYSGVAVGPTIYLGADDGVWVYENGVLERRLLSKSKAYVAGTKGHVFGFTSGGVFNLEGGVSSAPEFQFLQGATFAYACARPEGLYLCSTKGFFLWNNTHLTPVFQAAFQATEGEGRDGFYVTDDAVTISTYRGGLRAFSWQGDLLWKVGLSSLGGNPYSVVGVPEGLIVGTATGSVLVLPNFVSVAKLSGEDLMFVAQDHIGLSGSSVSLKTGEATPRQWVVSEGTDGSMGVTFYGEVILPGVGSVSLGTRSSARAIEPYGDGWVALQLDNLVWLGHDGSIRAKSPVSAGNSLLVTRGKVYVGTSEGMKVYTSPDSVSTIGHGLIHVSSPVESLFYDPAGVLMDLDGHLLAKLPGEVLAVSGKYALVRTSTGLAVGSYEPAWAPLDIPGIPDGAMGLVVDGTTFYVVSPSSILRAQAPKPYYLGHLAVPEHVMGGSEDYVQELPPLRLAPWANPELSVFVQGGAVPFSTEVRVPRLKFGATEIRFDRAALGLVDESKTYVLRPRPWWLGWPGAIAGGIFLVAFISLSVRWRTRVLRRREAVLTRMVADKTKALGEAMKVRELFFSSVSHEIRNPLNGVVGLCDILSESPVGAREKSHVLTLKGCADQLVRILDDVLDFSRIDRGEMSVYSEPFEVVSAVEGAARAIDPMLDRVRITHPEAFWVEGDVGKFRQVVTNLVSNALKYGQPSIAKLDLIQVQDDRGYLKIRVSVFNSGKSIPEEERESIFSGFSRGTDAKERRLPGTGLGLALSRRIMRAMGGDLTLRCAEGLTEFCMEVPLRPAAVPEVSRAPALRQERRALAIEDEPYNRLVLGHLLERMGYHVDWAVDGASALETIKSGVYDLILTDYMLPDTDGVALAHRMAKEVEVLPPMVMVTAYSTREKQEAAAAAGILGFVTKPITEAKLQTALMGLGNAARGRRSLDVYRPGTRFDFGLFLKMNEGRSQLARFADDTEADWTGLVSVSGKPEILVRASHALRGKVVLAHAADVAEQLGILEGEARAGHSEAIQRLLVVLEPMILDLVEAAREHALSPARF